jgi:uroporphyrinogen III methyltransferase/synthase
LQNQAQVFLVGAGPGDPGLITLRGIQCLRQADVILYDCLANEAILEHARDDAELVCLGQHGRSRVWTQHEINDRMVQLAAGGKCVVRLKGGDPAVFAHATEELQTLASHGIPFEVVPGITAALAAGSYAGIPITHREHASAVALVTGHEDADKDGSSLNYQALAGFPGTLVFYMGVTTATVWTQALMDAGKPPSTPTAIIRRCSLPDQLQIRCTLGEVVDVLNSRQIRPPAIVVIGEVAALSDSFSWFDKRPLFGQRVVVTRPRHQSAKLAGMLTELGAHVCAQEAIEIATPADWQPVDAALDQLQTFDWIVFSSANGVQYFCDRLWELGRDMRALRDCNIAAIGPATTEELEHYHLRADLQPDEFRAEALAAALSENAAGKRFLLVRASRGREVLAEQLTQAGGTVEQVVAYHSTDVAHPHEDVRRMLEAGEVDWITVTSSAIANSLVAMFGESLRKTQLASISPITTSALAEAGFEVAAEASEYTMPGVVEAILAAE